MTTQTTAAAEIRKAAQNFAEAAEQGCNWALVPEEVKALASILNERLWIADNDPGAFGTTTDTAAATFAGLVNARHATLTAEIEAFRAFTVDRTTPKTIHIDGQEYRSDRAYTDTAGDCWTYFGECDGSSLWHRDGETAAWNLAAVIAQFGPLTHPAGPHPTPAA